MTPTLKNRTALITGASQGLGAAIAHAYVKAGANIMICGRNGTALSKAREDLAQRAASNQIVASETADVSNPDDVKRLVDKTLELFPKVDILVNNAGIYGPKGVVEEVNWQEWLNAFEINLFGSILMCRLLLPHFKSLRYGKIINLSGGGATNPLPHLSAYAASKAAVVRFAETRAEEVRPYHIDVNSIAPGALNTRLLDEVIEAGPEKVGAAFYEKSLKQKAEGGISPEKGADLAVFLASSASDGITGKLISAIWDPWESFSERIEELQASDIYTLRRIITKDRGMEWGER